MQTYQNQTEQADESLTFVVAPLVEAFIEVRFPGDARIERWRGELQQKIRHEFPLLLVPQVREGFAPALQHYVFATEDQTKTILLAINSLAIGTKAYGGWMKFKEVFFEYWDMFVHDLAPEKLTRVGMAYLNRFEGDSPVSAISSLNLESPLFALLNEHTQSHQSNTTTRKADCQLNTQVRVENDEARTIVQVRYDAFYSEPSSPAELESKIEHLHQIIEGEFFKDIAPNLAVGLMPEGS